MHRLTNEQRTLADENRGLAASAAFKIWNRDHRRSDINDLKQAAMLGLCEAALSFDVGIGVSFATYASKACYNAALHEVVTQGVIHRPHWHARKLLASHPCERMLGIKARNTRCFEIGIHDVPQTDCGYDFAVIDQDSVNFIMATLDPEDRDILKSWSGGETQKSIGLRYGVFRQEISKRLKRIKGQLLRRFG